MGIFSTLRPANRPFHRFNVATAMAGYLTKKTGEPVQVAPLVVLPGWFVKISEKGNFPVWAMNATFLPGHLQRQSEKLNPHKSGELFRQLMINAGTWNFNSSRLVAKLFIPSL
jgi:hypothetical protein